MLLATVKMKIMVVFLMVIPGLFCICDGAERHQIPANLVCSGLKWLWQQLWKQVMDWLFAVIFQNLLN